MAASPFIFSSDSYRLFFYCLHWWPEINAGSPSQFHIDWMPSLSLSLSFFIDGFSLLFLLLITGIGTFIVLYASDYLHGHKDEGRFFFSGCSYLWQRCLGVVSSDNLLSLFVFWELTSITSYMLIGFHHESRKSRKLAACKVCLSP